MEENKIDQPEFSVEDLRQYFRFLFPIKQMYKWLTYSQPMLKKDKNNTTECSEYFYKREFSFTLSGDIYCRYNCFTNMEEFHEHLIKESPVKIDIGAVYNMPPRNHSSVDSGSFKPVSKELVFDIDISDYNDVRSCCTEANVCQKCWKLMSIAVKVMDASLREDFGYENLLWVFSGRRGIHCWVCDHDARSLFNDSRSAIVNYLSIPVGNEMGTHHAKIEIPLHPAYQRAKEIISDKFEEIMMKDQDILANEKVRERLLNILDGTAMKERVQVVWEECHSHDGCYDSINLWKAYRKCLKECPDLLPRNFKLDVIASAMFTLVYPRLDINVSKGMNHLLKAPFCVHPKTGKVCVPFDPEYVDEFDPNDCPTLSKSLSEYNTICSEPEFDKTKFYTVPSLSQSFETFKGFLKSVHREYTQIVSRENKLSESNVDFMAVEKAF